MAVVPRPVCLEEARAPDGGVAQALARRERTKGPKWVWALVIILGELIGPVIYLLVGRED